MRELTTNDLTAVDAKGTRVKTKLKSYTRAITITAVPADDDNNRPRVVSIQRLRPGSQTVVSAFQEERIAAAPFNVRIVLSEHPNGPDLADVNNLVEVENGTVSGLVIGVPFLRRVNGEEVRTVLTPEDTSLPHPIEGAYEHAAWILAYPPVCQGVWGMHRMQTDTVPLPTSDDSLYRQYRVTITPHQKSADFDVKVRIKSFHDNGAVIRYTYLPPDFGDSAFLPNGRDLLAVPVSGTARNLDGRVSGYYTEGLDNSGWWLLDRRSECGWFRNRDRSGGGPGQVENQ